MSGEMRVMRIVAVAPLSPKTLSSCANDKSTQRLAAQNDVF